MSTKVEIRVPDIGDFKDVEIIEVLVEVGDSVAEEESILTLESDKASMEIPSPASGTLASLQVKLGDRLSEGDLIGTLETAVADSAGESVEETQVTPVETADKPSPATIADTEEQTLIVPDLGGFENVEIIEVLVSEGDSVEQEQSLITLETDKASMEVPALFAGKIQSVLVKLGDKVSEGDAIAIVASSSQTTTSTAPAAEAPPPPSAAKPAAATETPSAPQTSPAKPSQTPGSPTAHIENHDRKRMHASPGVRRFARELGADLSLIKGSGRKGRILKDDVKQFVKGALENSHASYSGSAPAASSGGAIPAIPDVDFSKFGGVERVELGRIQKLSATNLHRAWLNLPMVTHHDEADITDLEAFRKSIKEEAGAKGIRVTGLAFHMKALAVLLKTFPKFNSSLSSDGQALFYKQYCHIGIAVDTPAGLVVPVFRDVDKKSIYQLAEEMADVSKRARDKKLKPDEMQGGCMTISSLGGIGGTAFTPIVNAPEVAILGITRARMQPVWNGSEFTPRLMCPLDLTYDHRVIDGADAARFLSTYCATISDLRRLIL